jgi:zinc protease
MSETDFEATKAYLSNFASLMTDGQSRQLGYALDSQYYEIDEFTSYVREGLASLTLADVNRVVRENLASADMRYVFVTNDATDLRQRLVDDRTSPMTYDAEKSEELLQSDKLIESLSLAIDEDHVTIVPAENVFN